MLSSRRLASAHGLSFRSPGDPKISAADRLSIPTTASAHSSNRGSRTGWSRYDLASSAVLMEHCSEVGLKASPPELREDVPQPMRALLAALDLRKRALVVLLLRTPEAAQAVRVVRGGSAPCVSQWTSHASLQTTPSLYREGRASSSVSLTNSNVMALARRVPHPKGVLRRDDWLRSPVPPTLPQHILQ